MSDGAGHVPRLDRAVGLLVQVPFRRPFLTAVGELTHRTSWIIRIRDMDGREGFGEAALDPGASDTSTSVLASAVRETITALAAGRVPDATELAMLGEPGRALSAALECAIETVRTGPAGAPGEIKRAAGDAGGRADLAPTTVAVNATLGFAAPDAAAEAALSFVALGFRTLKLKAGAERETDALVDRVRAVRRAVGPGVRLRLDVNGAWDLATAQERLGAVERFDLEYVEQPLPAWDLAGHAALRGSVGVPIALDESIASAADAAEAMGLGAADMLVVKPARVGGSSVVEAIAARAWAAGVPVVISTFFETGIGIGAALRAAASIPLVGRERAHGLATGGVLAHDLLVAPIVVAEGRMEVPVAPLVDDDALRHYTRDTAEPVG